MHQRATDDVGGNPASNAPRPAQICNLLGMAFCVASLVGSVTYWPTSASACVVAAGYLAAVLLISRLLAGVPANARWFCLGLAALSLTLRAAWALSVYSPPQDDYGDYWSAALDALHGDWYALKHTFWPWGNTLWLYTIVRAFGPSLKCALLANALVGTATTVLVYAAGRRLIPEPAARMGAALYALCPAAIFWGSLLCAEIPHLFLFLTGLLALLAGLDASEPQRPAPRTSLFGSWLSSPRQLCLVSGGLLLAAADFFRPVSPLLLAPLLLHVWNSSAGTARDQEARRRKRGRGMLLPVAAYAVGVAVFLSGKSLVTGYPNLTPSYTLGMNLACGLNWQARGKWNAADDRAIMVSDDPREVNRAGLDVARARLGEMVSREPHHLLMLPIRKFPLNWSSEQEAYYANAAALPKERRASHWLIRQEGPLRAVLQLGHLLVVALAGVGFWRHRRSERLALVGVVIAAFLTFHAAFEVQDRYHFAVEALLMLVAGSALFPFRLITRVRPRGAR